MRDQANAAADTDTLHDDKLRPEKAQGKLYWMDQLMFCPGARVPCPSMTPLTNI